MANLKEWYVLIDEDKAPFEDVKDLVNYIWQFPQVETPQVRRVDTKIIINFIHREKLLKDFLEHFRFPCEVYHCEWQKWRG